MADSLLFDGVDDSRTYSAGNIAGNGALSLAMIVKPSGVLVDWRWSVNWNAGGSSGFGALNALLWISSGTQPTGPTIVTDEWWLLGFSKATGTVTPRYHTYRYSTTTWAHGTFSGTITNYPACTSIRFMDAPGELFAGNLLIAGVWDSELADGTFETLEAAQADWVTAAPDEAWRFDTTGAISPFVGTSTQTGSTGATLDTGDAPAGWADITPPATDLIASPRFPDFPKMKLRTT